MAKEHALQFILHANKDQMLQSRLRAINDGRAGLVRLGNELGFDFTAEEMQTVVAEQQNPDSGELSDEALELVSGGLVVIAIIGVLIGQLTPAIQK